MPALANPIARPEAALARRDEELLDALERLIESGRAQTVGDLARYAGRAHAAEAAEFLHDLDIEGHSLTEALNILSTHLQILADQRNRELQEALSGRSIGLILPLPADVLDLFLSLSEVTVLVPDGHAVPLSLCRHGDIRRGSRACRRVLGQLDVLVFEAYRGAAGLSTDVGAADLLEGRALASDNLLIVQLRPDRNPEDLPLNLPTENMRVL